MLDLVSTVGDSPVTVMVSASCPTSSLALIVAVNAALIAMSARSMVLKPCSSNFSVYAPGGSRSKRYAPLGVGRHRLRAADQSVTGKRHEHARHDRAAAVSDRAHDGTGLDLRAGAASDEQESRTKQYTSEDRHGHPHKVPQHNNLLPDDTCQWPRTSRRSRRNPRKRRDKAGPSVSRGSHASAGSDANPAYDPCTSAAGPADLCRSHLLRTPWLNPHRLPPSPPTCRSSRCAGPSRSR